MSKLKEMTNIKTEAKDRNDEAIEFLVEFPKPTIVRNLEHLRSLNGNGLVRRIRDGQTTYTKEVQDLFYFFEGYGQYLKSLIRTPKLKDNHDQRVSELEKVLNGVDLLSNNDKEEYTRLKSDIDNGKKKLPPIGFGAGVAAYAIESNLRYYEGLGGRIKFEQLYSNKLEEHLRKRSVFNRAFTIAPSSVAALTYPLLPTDAPDKLFLSAIATLSTVALSLMSSIVYAPLNYGALSAKAEKFDQFIEKYQKLKDLLVPFRLE